MSFERFRNLVNTSDLYLARIDQFSDFVEGSMPRKTRERNYRKMAAQGGGDISHVIPRFNKMVSNCWYASCWTRGEKESNLLWRAYGQPENTDEHKFKVAIKTTVKGLMDSVYDDSLVLGRIKYYDDENEDPIRNETGVPHGSLVYSKRKEYKSEKEVRLAWFNSKGAPVGFVDFTSQPTTPLGVTFKTDLNILIENIYIEAIQIKREHLNNYPESFVKERGRIKKEADYRKQLVKDLLSSNGVEQKQIHVSHIL